MEQQKNKKVYIIGHKNPDTDSICSAITYADIKRRLTGNEYAARRAGQINEETRYVLDRFNIEEPAYLPNVGTQVKDIDIRHTEGVKSNISLKKAWTRMRENNIVTLPITKENQLEGLITIGNIATSYMDVYDSKILSAAHTQYKNIIETLEGNMIVGNPHSYFVKGKVLIASATPDLMEDYIERDDLVILGNRYESQLSAIEMGAGCIIVCEGSKVALTIKKLAEENSCSIISTPHDTYTVARLINQSIPIKHFMSKENLVTFKTDDFIEDIKAVMAKKRHRDFPIEDKHGNYVGMISRRNLMDMKRKQVILVDHNEKSQTVDGIEEAEILEIIDHHRLGSLETFSPVYFRNQPVGCTATIMYQIYQEHNLEIDKGIAGLLCAAIISDTLMYRSPTCTQADKEACQTLADIAGISVIDFAQEMFHAGSNLKYKSPEEIFYQDFKKFSAGDVTFGVGQINSMDSAELKEIREKLIPYLEKAYKEHGVSMIFFMLTDIIEETTELLYQGENARRLIEESFNVQPLDGSYILKGIVSRKKQLIPAFMISLQQ